MRPRARALLCLIAALSIASVESASAQKGGRGFSPNIGMSRPGGPVGRPDGGGHHGGGHRGPGWGGVVPGIILSVPPRYSPNGPFIDDETTDDGPPGRAPRRSRQANRRGPSGAPPANERRLVPDEVVIELANSVSNQQIDSLQRRHRLTRLESQTFPLTGTTLYRWRIPDRRSVRTVVRELEADRIVASAQPNYLYTLQQNDSKREGDAAQYGITKLRLPEAHSIAKGENVLVAVIDSAIDGNHPELEGSIAENFDVLSTTASPHQHGTAIAGLIAAHGKLMGAAPSAKILAVRAFDPKSGGAEGTTFNILKAIDWAAAHNARVINMSFAGPSDPAIRRALEAAHRRKIVLVAAAGNAGAKSPPLYPAADPNVIAVSATDPNDKLFEASNRGRHIAVAAPGDQILVAIPEGSYEISSGTSYSAAEVSGIVALMLQYKPELSPDKVKAILRASARDLGPKGTDVMFGAGLADAYRALTLDKAALSESGSRPVERVSTGAR
ncbi:MAG TPA: S8 family serine peptidase [Pseudolabrys sp.]|nr:S8 family serine peptidase [Pseudolabrys sp.]